MIPTDVLRKKRDGIELDDAEIQAFLDGYAKGEVPDYQMSAFAMAVFFRGMTPRELSR
jgi:pyrimidine-nucleoside phosphorylase